MNSNSTYLIIIYLLFTNFTLYYPSFLLLLLKKFKEIIPLKNLCFIEQKFMF
jgi:hypothetical protein